jgi:D-alanyl-D-alanine carboxypeptidase/D-alanyl-D-alanine-endopeptidase (penicillin-binding protein 4)
VRRIAALACLIAALLAPAAEAAGPGATRRALEREMRRAGPASGALVVDLGSGARVYGSRAGSSRVPASVEKLYTTATALRRLGADARLATSVSATVLPDAVGTVAGDLFLRGGGDPTFAKPDLNRLADEVEAAGVATVTGRVLGDETAFDGFRGPPSSGLQLSRYVGPLSALTFNRGLTGKRSPYFQAQPARFAARALTRELRRRGVVVAGDAGIGATPPGAPLLAEWDSPPMVELARRTNVPSDNFSAETLLKVLGSRLAGVGSTAAGAGVVRAELGLLGIRPAVVDGSGLSRANRTSPRQVVSLLSVMDGEAAFEGSLAVAGRTGTLATRMRGTAAQDRCRAKTGTLSDVSALAGYCTTTGGSDVAFAILMNGVNPSAARALQDRMAAALARYTP